ncbi:MAG TPA: histone deacetylase [Desulfobacteraceae bacterium]|nr:histone deacetylase [Desulfobacteraceae bacterium]
MARTLVYRDELFLEHEPGFDHVESPDRLKVVYDELDREGTWPGLMYPHFEPASLEVIGLNHSPGLIKRIAETAGRRNDFLDADTRTSARSFAAACLAAGSVVDGIQRIAAGEADNGFCLVRPPGHHAERDRAMGFCLFNNIAVGAKWALTRLGLKRIVILDWDLHHGNGTQRSFYDTDEVLYCSVHQYPFYPGTGALLETGAGRGEGFTLNVPLPGGQGDHDYLLLFTELFVPVIRRYRPQFILVSCGFDIYGGDPLGAMRVSSAGFAGMTGILLNLARELCDGRLLLVLEGGYNLSGMRDGTIAVLTELCGRKLNPSHPDYSVAVEEPTGDRLPWFIEQAVNLAKSLGKM